MGKYERKFNKFLAELTSLKEEYNSSNSSKIDYRNIIAAKTKLLLDNYHFDSRKANVEDHVVIIASLLPEWATSYKKLSYRNQSKAEKANLIDYKNFYRMNTTLQRPENMWKAKRKIRFEYFKYEINLQTSEVKEKHKFLTYDDTFAIYKKHQQQLEQIRADLHKIIRGGGGVSPAIGFISRLELLCSHDVSLKSA